ncbi:MAG: hypothetical protein IEMM0007_1157 [bacterium]|nr:MAG: hypothetical protein IEMM0007_1157 [bacterium]
MQVPQFMLGIKKTEKHQLETGMKRFFFITTIVFALTGALLTTGYAETKTETAGYGHAQMNSKGSMEGQPGHMEHCGMMMKHVMMMKITDMMKRSMEIQKKMLLEPAKSEKKEMVKELDLMIGNLDKMMSKMHMMMKNKMEGAAGGCPAAEHQHKKETDAGK